MEGSSWCFACELTSEFPARCYYHLCWEWQDMPRVPKITILQYLCNISKKRWGINMIFSMKINIKVFFKLTVSFIARCAQSIQHWKLVLSLQYLKKEERDVVGFFCMEINIKLSYRWMLLILMGMTRYAQIA